MLTLSGVAHWENMVLFLPRANVPVLKVVLERVQLFGLASLGLAGTCGLVSPIESTRVLSRLDLDSRVQPGPASPNSQL